MPFPHPRDAGAHLTTTWPVGQLADFAPQLEIGTAPLLIREFDDRYEAFIAAVQLTQQIVYLIEANPSASFCIGGALVGAAIGSAMTRDRSGALIGLGLGLLVTSILQPQFTDDRQGQRFS